MAAHRLVTAGAHPAWVVAPRWETLASRKARPSVGHRDLLALRRARSRKLRGPTEKFGVDGARGAVGNGGPAGMFGPCAPGGTSGAAGARYVRCPPNAQRLSGAGA